MNPEDPPRDPFPLRYKLMLGFILSAPFAGCIFAFVIPLTVEKKKEAEAAEAVLVVEAIVKSVQDIYAATCALPPALPRLTDPSSCCGIRVCAQDVEPLEAWRSAGVFIPSAPSAFTFEAASADDGTYRVRAITDFRCDASINHTFEVTLRPETGEGACVLRALPGMTTNEFY